MEPAISKARGRDFDDLDRRMLDRVWSARGCAPFVDSSHLSPDGSPRVDGGVAARPKWAPVLVPMQCSIVTEFMIYTAECTRDDSGRPSPRDFDHVMQREGLGPRRQQIMRSLLRSRNQEASAIYERTRKKHEKK